MKIEIEIEKEDAFVFVGAVENKDISQADEAEILKITKDAVEKSIVKTVIGIKVRAYEAQLIQEKMAKREGEND